MTPDQIIHSKECLETAALSMSVGMGLGAFCIILGVVVAAVFDRWWPR